MREFVMKKRCLFKKAGVVGIGLIGGSLCLGMKKLGICGTVIGVGRNPAKLRRAEKSGIIDGYSTDYSALSDADFVAVCLPVDMIVDAVKNISRFVKPGCVVIDVGSTKEKIMSAMDRIRNVSFVGCHPIAGSEKSGMENADVGLFSGTTCVITPVRSTGREAIRRVKILWKRLGARVVAMSPDEHDRILSVTSHLPHFIAFALSNFIAEKAGRNPAVKTLCGTGLKDATRIAMSSAGIWETIFFENRKNIQKQIRGYCRELHGILKAKRQKGIAELILRANRFRKGL